MASKKSNVTSNKASNKIAYKKKEERKHQRNYGNNPSERTEEESERNLEEFGRLLEQMDRDINEGFARWDAEMESLPPIEDLEELDPETKAIFEDLDDWYDECMANENNEEPDEERRRRIREREEWWI